MDDQVPAAQALRQARGLRPLHRSEAASALTRREREALDDAVAELAYGFQTPLTAIVGFAELLRSRDSEHVRREAPRHIQALAEDLLRELDERLDRVLTDDR